MRLDNPDMWIIVERSPRDTKSFGKVVRVGMHEEKARRIAEQLNISFPSENHWAMRETDYGPDWIED